MGLFARLGIDKHDKFRALKIAVWVYFFLLIFEGALRKWVLPEIQGPLIFIRDPVAIFLILGSINKRVFPANIFVVAFILISVISLVATLLLGHGNLIVALYGIRILVIHFPIMFIMGRIFTRKDVLRIGIVTLWLSIPMAILIGVQFYSPQDAWVNLGVGADVSGAGFRGALGYFRPPATFSFTNGTTLFFSLVAPFVVYFVFNLNKYGRVFNLVILGSVGALVASVPLSISRALFFQVAVTIVFTLLAASRSSKYRARAIGLSALLGITLLVLSQTTFFATGTDAFTARFESANKREGGLNGVVLDRFLGGMIGTLKQKKDPPFFGVGIGMGTNVGSYLLSGKRKFLVAEAEWGRVIGEMGLFLGLFLILIRLSFSIKVTRDSYNKMIRGDMLPWLLVSFGFMMVLQGQWAQPTALGFSTIIGGLILASLNTPKPNTISSFRSQTSRLSLHPPPIQ